MPITLIMDTVARAIITDNIATGPRLIRTGIIKGINTLGMTADQVFAQVSTAPGLPSFRSYYPAPPYTDCQLTGIAFEPFEGQPGKTRVLCTYERLGLGTPIVTFILQRQTTMVETVTELHPKDLTPLIVTWIKWKNILGVNVPTEVVMRTARFRYRRPYQRVTATGYYRDGPPPADMLGALGTVNDSTWRGLSRGYWFYAGQSDVTRDKGNTYTITLELETQLRQDWSQYQVLEDINGRYLQPDPADVADLRGIPYDYDVKYRNGITKTGLYPLANFSAVFGFGGIA